MLSLKERWIFALILPLCMLVIGYFLVIGTTHGEGSSIGFRAIGALIALPVVALVAFVVNFFVAFPSRKSRSSSFALGMIAPALALAGEYIYLWQVFREYPDIG